MPSDYSIQLFLPLFIYRKGVTKLLIWELTLWRKETILGRHLIINLSIYPKIYLKIQTSAIVPSVNPIQLILSLFIYRKGVTKLLIWALTLWRKEKILGHHLIIYLSIYIRIYLKIDTNAIALFSFLRKELQTLLQWSAFSSSFSFSSKKKLASNSKKGTPQRDPPLRKRN